MNTTPIIPRDAVNADILPKKTVQTEQAPIKTAPNSLVEMFARGLVVPVALVLDIVTMLIRVTETTIQLTIPDVYKQWQDHVDPRIAILYYVVAIVVVAGLSIGVTASLFLAMPLLYLIDHRIEAAQKVRNRRTRKEMLAFLKTKRSRYQGYTRLAVAVPVLFGVSYFLNQQHWEFIKWVTAVADIAAPIIVLFVITQTEREHKDIDAQEEAIVIATDVVMSNMRSIKDSAGGLLKKEQAAMLKAGTEGDVEGMIDAATPRDDVDRLYTIVEICRRLGVSTERDSKERKKVYRIVVRAVHEGETEIRRDRKGRGYLVPGKLFDKLFGDWLAERQGLGQTIDSHRTVDTSRDPLAQGLDGHRVDMNTDLPVTV
jgi:hypothetical protein